MSGYRTDYKVSDVIDLNNATCQQVTTPESDTPFLVTIELLQTFDRDGGVGW